ncbi:MAG TPA: FAD binding domain-containing protein, partial [Ilumatobacteraceae bacterium]|nr:FAD binding domain-containing protein [Ilumatobacteraceae bacterium]
MAAAPAAATGSRSRVASGRRARHGPLAGRGTATRPAHNSLHRRESRIYPSRFRYEAPRSLDEAIGLLNEGGGEAKVLAGGQSLVPMLKLRFASPELLVDINNIAGLGYHKVDPDGTIRIGALCRHADLEHSTLLAAKQPTMTAAAP